MRSGESRGRFTSGFTLLELAVVIAIIALVMAMTVTSGVAVISSTRQVATTQKMAAIDQALMAYRIANDRLPCPADLTLAPSSANYGYEAGYASGGTGTGECKTGMTPAANNEAAGLTNTTATAAEGAVPTASLGIPSDYMYDGWGNRIRYAVDISATLNGVFPTLGVGCNKGAITVYDATGSQARSTGALYALISQGANEHGGYTRNGVMYNAGSTNTNELTNCHCTAAAAAGTYSPAYVQAPYYIDPTTNTDNFDDIVTYKERWQMQTAWDAGGPICGIGNVYFSDRNNQRIRMVNALTGVISTIAGNGTAAYGGDNGAATGAELYYPDGITMDSSGNLYIADGSARIRKVTASTGIITTVAGNGTGGYGGDNGQATGAEINGPYGVALDSSGNIYIADTSNNRIRKVTASTGIITTVAGNGTGAYGGDGTLAAGAEVNGPYGVAVDGSGNIYIGDTSNNRVRKVTASTGLISTVAGNGTASYGGDNGPATSAALNAPNLITADSSGNIYISDFNNVRIRKLTVSSGVITTVVGNGTAGIGGNGGQATAATINGPTGIGLDSAGNLYFGVWWGNYYVRKVTTATGIIGPYVGSGTTGFAGDGGQATAAQINTIDGVLVAR